VLRKINQKSLQAVTTGWIYDGNEIHDFGIANPIILTNPGEKALTSTISDREVIFNGSFPEYELKIGNIVNIKMTKGDFLEDRCAHGVFIPPFGIAWVDVYSNVSGFVLGEEFDGTAHLQKVIGVMPYGPFHWARIVFQDNSTFSFFCLKPGKSSKMIFHEAMNFYDHKTNSYIQFKKPKLKISEGGEEVSKWTVEGWDNDNELKIVLEVYAEKSFRMSGGGSQVYVEYAVKPSEFNFRQKDKVITLKDLGEGVGTFENAYYGLAFF
jgi:hypothetical protein